MRSSRFFLVLFLLAGGLALLSCSQQNPNNPPEVFWFEGLTWDQIVDRATRENRPIFLDFYATWCGPCKLLDDSVYVVPEVINELRDFVTFKVDVDDPAYAELKDAFHIFNMPTLVLCHPDGSEIDRFLGYRPAPEFLQIVRDYRAGRNTLADVEAHLAEHPDDVQFLLAAGTKHAQRLDEALARAQLARVLDLDARNDQGQAAPALDALAELEWKLGDYDSAIATYRRLMADYAGTAEAEMALGMIAYCQRRQGDTAGMIATYREMVAQKPGDVGALNRFAWNAAKAGVALEEATDMALKAVALSDEEAGVMDTLAEVYYARGMYPEAISWIRKAIAKEPDDKYLQDQLAKFEKAAQEGQP
jgi:tetratricopeptide (TPR) repeat protein